MGGKPLKRMVERPACVYTSGTVRRIWQVATDDVDEGTEDGPNCIKLDEIHAEGTGAELCKSQC